MTKRKPWGLFLAIMAAVMLLMVIMYVPLLGGAGTAHAATSPLARLAILTIVIGCAILGLIALWLKRLTERPHPPLHKVWTDEGGTAAVELLLALPFILMIMLLLVQATLMWNDNMLMHHAGFAAARAALTIVRSEVQESGEIERVVFNNGADYNGYPYAYGPPPPSLKMPRIKRAAVMALLPVSGELSTSVVEDPEMTGDEIADAVRQAMVQAEQDPAQPWINHLARKFAYGDYYTTVDIRRPWHWRYDEPDRGEHCPRASSIRGDWNPTLPGQYERISVCRWIPGHMDFARWEEIQVKLNYSYELKIPYANRVFDKLSNDVYEDTTPDSGRRIILTDVEIFMPYRADQIENDRARYTP
ncbi:MAG: hypothetical protein JXL80_14340 [Planctomycetes bacterium]|nr:hypothetical protein [Planctomycetota bacterium]